MPGGRMDNHDTSPQGRNHGWKVEGTKVWVPTRGPLRPATGQAEWVRGVAHPLPLWGSGYSIFRMPKASAKFQWRHLNGGAY